MRRLLLTLVAALALAGCATQPRYGYHDDGADYYYGATTDYVPDYIAYGAYYDALWPVYHNYYDPFYAPGFRYGVTWFPTNWYGFGGGWGGYPYWGYSPWRHSWYDGYYDWAYWNRHRPGRSDWHRFGSSRSEAAQVAAMRRDSAPLRRDGNPGLRSGFAGERGSAGRDVGAGSRAGFAGDRGSAGRDVGPGSRSSFAGERGTRDTDGASLRNNGRDIQGQVPTRGVGTADRYYGEPRVHRGEGPRREANIDRSYERGDSFRGAPGRYNDAAPMRRDAIGGPDRAWRQPTPPSREASMRSSPVDRGGYAPSRSDRSGAPMMRSAPVDRGKAPMMRSAPMDRGGAPMMRSAPSAPAMRSAPAPAMRSAPSAPSRSAGPSSRGNEGDR